MSGRSGSGPDPVVVEGRWAVEALLEAPYLEPGEVFVEAGRHPDLVARCAERSIPCRELPGGEISAKAGYQFHRGAYAVAGRPPPQDPGEAFLATARRLLVPVDLADAGNLGTLIRSAVAFGVDGVLVEAGRGVDVYARKCIRASATAIFRIPVFEVRSLAATLDRIAEAGFVLLGASLGEGSRPVSEVRPGKRCAVLLGAEGEGLPPALELLCAERVRLPMSAGMDSLNVAVSGSILLWEWFGREQS